MKWLLSILAFGGSSGEAKPMTNIKIEQVDPPAEPSQNRESSAGDVNDVS